MTYGMFSVILIARITLDQLPVTAIVAVTMLCEETLSTPEASDDIDSVELLAGPIDSTASIKGTALLNETRNDGNDARWLMVFSYTVSMFFA